MILIAICGASASGKTSLAQNIVNSLNKSGKKSMILSIDSYYICHPELPFSERTLLNYDAPESFDFTLLKSDIARLSGGKPITTKCYDFGLHLRHDTDELIYPPDVLVLEGIHTFADKELLSKCDLKLYVDTDSDVCIVRRMCRDTKKRDRTVDAIAAQYLDTVKPMFDQYIRLYKNDADLCVVGGGHNEKAVSCICTYILSLFNTK